MTAAEAGRRGGVHPRARHARRRRADLRPEGHATPSVVIIVKPLVEPSPETYEQGVRVAHRRRRPESSGIGEPDDQEQQPAEQALAGAGGHPARRVRGRHAQLPRRADRVHDGEPVRRQGRCRPDAAARRRGCCRASRASSCSRSAVTLACPCASRCCETTILFSRGRSVPDRARRAKRCRSLRVDDRTIGSGKPGPVTQTLLKGFRDRARADRYSSRLKPALRVEAALDRPRRAGFSRPVTRQTLRPAGTSRTGCGRRSGLSIRPTLGQNLFALTNGSGNAACSREYGCVHSVADDGFRGVRRVLQHVVLPIGPARHDVLNLPADLNHRVAEAIELRLVLALGRLDHQRARPPGTTPSARGSRSPSAASRRPSPRCRRP